MWIFHLSAAAPCALENTYGVMKVLNIIFKICLLFFHGAIDFIHVPSAFNLDVVKRYRGTWCFLF